MRKESKEESLARKLIKEAGLEKPSSNFSVNVLYAIEKRKAVVEFKPLLSKKLLIGLAFLMASSLLVLFFMTTGFSLQLHLNYFNFPSFPQVEFSRNMLYAIGFVSLFFLQIPVLKSLLEKQFR